MRAACKEMIAFMLKASTLFWSASHVVGIGIASHLWRRERHAAYAWFALSWLAMSIAGFTVGERTTLAHVMTISMRLVASVTGLVALWMLSRLARSRVITLYTTKGGDIVGRAHHDVIVEHDTIPPPP